MAFSNLLRRLLPSRLSLGTKLALATVCVVGAVSALLFVQITARERLGLLRAKEVAASMVADLFATSLAAPLDFGDSDAVDTEIEHLRQNPDVTCALVWPAAKEEPIATLDRGACRGVAAPTAAEEGHAQVLEGSVRVARRVVGRNGEAVGATVLVFSLGPENAAYVENRGRLFRVAVLLAGLTALVLIAIAREQIVVPLAALGVAAKRIGEGDLRAEVQAMADDEIGQLARGLNAMREAIGDRERRLEAATQSLRDLFDHMRQAILAFGPGGLVTGAVSRQATRLFGRDDLEGANVVRLLYPDALDVDAQAFDEWVAMAFQMPLSSFGELAALAPQEVVVTGPHGRPIPLVLEFRPIAAASGALDRVMLLATDVSETRRLEATVQTQEEEHGRRMAAMRRLVAGGGQVFVSFMDAARERIARCREIVGDAPRNLAIAEIDELFRHVHTIKGEARAFDLRDLEAETAKLEEELDELRAAARGDGFATTASVHGLLSSRLRRAEEGVERGCDAFVAASPIGHAALDQMTVQRSDVMALAAQVEGRDDPVAKLVARLASRPFGESVATLTDMAPTWAEREGKSVHVAIEGKEVRVPAPLARVLPAVLTHLVRNAVAHGIEPRAQRVAAGKPEQGTIRAIAVETPDGPEITLEDDGRGLDLARIAERAAAMGLDATTGASELVFLDGLSTTEGAGSLSGRGVGLGAVRADLSPIGYTLDVVSEPSRRTRFRVRPRPGARLSIFPRRPTHAQGGERA